MKKKYPSIIITNIKENKQIDIKSISLFVLDYLNKHIKVQHQLYLQLEHILSLLYLFLYLL